METPIYDFLKNYSRSGTLRLHMPGHKGKALKPFDAFSFDITEIDRADSLYESSGIISKSEENISKIYNTAKTLFSAGGSTLCIQTMLTLMKLENRRVIAQRNVHKSFISACGLLGIEPLWLFPDYSDSILSGEFPYSQAQKLLKENPCSCIYITSPDYLGKTADIEKISGLCKKYGAYLLTDNAHGGHLIATGCHPMQKGADMCCDSAHKMLPALTGGAFLHIKEKRLSQKAKQAMSYFGSTSPSYLIMTSLDLCGKYLSESLPEIQKTADALINLKKELREKYTVFEGEPFHLTLLCDGIDLADKLRKLKIECEYADRGVIVLLFSPLNSPEDIKRVLEALLKCSPKPPAFGEKIDFPQPKKAMSIRKALLSEYEILPVEDSCGRICAGINVPCPPAVPITVCGEIIDENCIKIFKRYGILNVNVVK